MTSLNKREDKLKNMIIAMLSNHRGVCMPVIIDYIHQVYDRHTIYYYTESDIKRMVWRLVDRGTIYLGKDYTFNMRVKNDS